MKTINKSTLIGQKATLVGSGFQVHLVKKDWITNITVYFVKPNRYIICLNELRRQDARPQAQIDSLGTEVPAELIMPFAQRELQGTNLENIGVIKEALLDLKLKWI